MFAFLLCDLPKLSLSQNYLLPSPDSLPVKYPCHASLYWGFLKHSLSPCTFILLLPAWFLPIEIVFLSYRDHVLHSYFCIRPAFLSSHINFLISSTSCFSFHSLASVFILSQTSLFFLKISVHCVTRLRIMWDPQHHPQLFSIWKNIMNLTLKLPTMCAHFVCFSVVSLNSIFCKPYSSWVVLHTLTCALEEFLAAPFLSWATRYD